MIAQFGGQTALNLIRPLAEAGVKILGTPRPPSPLTEDREEMAAVCGSWASPCRPGRSRTARTSLQAFAPQIGFPVLVRPSYVLGGRGMRIIRAQAELAHYLGGLGTQPRQQPVLVDHFLEDAMEIDVDGISDGRDIFMVIMEQIEEAGVHSGDSACVYPPQTLAAAVIAQVRATRAAWRGSCDFVGLINVQYAVKDGLFTCWK